MILLPREVVSATTVSTERARRLITPWRVSLAHSEGTSTSSCAPGPPRNLRVTCSAVLLAVTVDRRYKSKSGLHRPPGSDTGRRLASSQRRATTRVGCRCGSARGDFRLPTNKDADEAANV